MKGTINIQTDRLLLRKIELDDYERIYNCWTSDPKVSQYVTWKPHKNKEETKMLTEYWVKEYLKEYTYRWLVETKETHEVIGMIDAIHVDLQYMTVEVGYCYGSKCWGNGYATECLKAVIDFLHKEGFAVVYAQHFKSNPVSGKVMEKAGMEYEALLRSRVINNNNEREDVLMYSSVNNFRIN